MMAPAEVFEWPLPDVESTARLARRLAQAARPRDIIALHGALGSGKTTLARFFIHERAAMAGESGEDVPSPTFTLVQVYDFPASSVWHFDLYRLNAAEEALELGIGEAFDRAISLIEWPEKLGSFLPANRLDLYLEFSKGESEARHAKLSGSPEWMSRLARTLDHQDHDDANRHP